MVRQSSVSLPAVLVLGVVCWSPAANAGPLRAAREAFRQQSYARVLTLLPQRETSDARLMRARTLLKLGRYPAALKLLHSLRRKMRHVADLIHYLEAQALEKLGRYREAGAAYARCIAARPSRWTDRARVARARALSKAGQLSAARHAYAKVLKSQPDHWQRPQLELEIALLNKPFGSQAKARAAALQDIWLKWPATDAAETAGKEVQKMLRARPGLIAAPSRAERMDRAHRLRRARAYDEAVQEYVGVARMAPQLRADADYWRAYTLRKAGRAKDALKVLKRLYATEDGKRARVRSELASALGAAGQIDAAVALYKDDLPPPGDERITARQRSALSQTAWLLARHGRYADALRHYQRIAQGAGMTADLRERLAWLSYRAGRYDEAIEGFKKAYQNNAFSLYWQARAHAKAGRLDQATRLYQNLVEQDLRGYYGHLARNRLVEMGKQQASRNQCTTPKVDHWDIAARQPERADKLLRSMTRHYGRLLPRLVRGQILWSQGLLREARSELRLAALDYAWAAYRGRRNAFKMREEPLRIWKGEPLINRTWGRRERRIRAEDPELRHSLAQLMHATGLSYFAWRLEPPVDNPERQAHPPAYAHIVLKIAKRFGLDPHLLWAIMRTESANRPDAISRVKAAGLMQIMPRTAERLAKQLAMTDFDPLDVFDPETNLTLAASYLSALQSKFRGQVRLMAAAYNGGPHNVADWLDYRGNVTDTDEFIEEIPFTESRRYAKGVSRRLSLYRRTYCSKDDLVLANKLDATYEPYPNF